MKMIYPTCPHCNRRCEIMQPVADTHVQCPGCKKKFTCHAPKVAVVAPTLIPTPPSIPATRYLNLPLLLVSGGIGLGLIVFLLILSTQGKSKSDKEKAIDFVRDVFKNAAKNETEFEPEDSVLSTDVGVEIRSVAIHEADTSPKKWLVVGLRITNRHKTKLLEYKSWEHEDRIFVRRAATLRDNFGNAYKMFTGYDWYNVTESFGCRRESSTTMYPETSVEDAVVFEAPVDSAEYVDLELAGKCVGAKTKYRFRILAKDFKGGTRNAQPH